MTPFRIDFKLAGPVGVPQHPIHLDGLLAWLNLDRDAPQSQRQADIDAAITAVPLKKHQSGVFQGSAIAFAWEGPHNNKTWIRRTDEQAVARFQLAGGFTNRREDSKIELQSGPLRNALGTYELGWATRAIAYGIGDVTVISDLTERLESIGRYRRYGYGIVRDVTVTPDPAGNDLWKARYLPADTFDEGILCNGRVTPPYFQRSGRVLVRDNTGILRIEPAPSQSMATT